ncbi:MAG: MAPEG family protein [Alphaproteobacteria bacterium]
MTPELYYLVAACVLSLVMWIPYILGRIGAWGLVEALGYPKRELPQPDWAVRMKSAHANLVENLAPFAGLVLVAHVAGLNNEMTALGAAIFFFARVAHAVLYTFGVPVARTLSFAAGLVGCFMIASVFI